MTTNTQKFLWVCELNKDEPSKKWNATDVMELEDEEDSDFMVNTLVLKSAMLGSKAQDGERNVVGVKTKGIQENNVEHPIFSLRLGANEMISNFDLTLSSSEEVEFKLLEGTGPVYITCSHVLEMPSEDAQQTIMTTSDGASEDEECEDDEEVEEEEAAKNGEENGEAEENGKTAKAKRTSNGKNGNTAQALKAKLANGKNGADHANGKKDEIEVDEKPNKRKRN